MPGDKLLDSGGLGPEHLLHRSLVPDEHHLHGKLINFAAVRQGTQDSTAFDRMLYIEPAGKLMFGIRTNDTYTTLASPGSVTDGAWHHAVGTLGSSGMRLYLDGVEIGANESPRAGAAFSGWWKIGCGGNFIGWPTSTGAAYVGPNYYTGQLQYAAIYSTQLSATQITEHYLAGIN